MGAGLAIKDILTIMSDKQVLTSTTWHPIINCSRTKSSPYNFARNSTDLKALNLLHDDLIIPCHRRKHQ
jgi:hypothetical protein